MAVPISMLVGSSAAGNLLSGAGGILRLVAVTLLEDPAFGELTGTLTPGVDDSRVDDPLDLLSFMCAGIDCGHGACDASVCTCTGGYYGDNCETQRCCSRGLSRGCGSYNSCAAFYGASCGYGGCHECPQGSGNAWCDSHRPGWSADCNRGC